MGLFEVLTFLVRVDIEVMAMKRYFALPRHLEIELHYLVLLSAISSTPFF